MNRKIIFLLIISTALIFSCKTDFDINADYKDISLVYGLLNQNDTAHYIKLNKAFLGSVNAYEMAAHSDSINYANADMYLDEMNSNNVILRKIYFSKTNEFTKDTGIFATDNNYMYKAKATLGEEYSYKLNINIGSKHISSETKLIRDFSIIRPLIYATASAGFDNYNAPYRLEWKSAINGKIYEVVLRLHFIEKAANGDTTSYYIDWKQPSKLATNTEGGETLKLDIGCEGFFQFVKSALQVKAGATRIVKKASINFIFSVGSDDLNTYIEVSKPSEGLVQDKPAYTNIENGIGIFSSRFFKSVTLKLNVNTIDSLAHGSYTKDLGFWDYEQTSVSEYWANK